MCVYQRSSKYQFHNLWLDPTKARTHIPSHTRRGRLPPPSIYFLQYDLNSKVTIVSLFCLPTSSVYNLRLNDGKDPLLCFCITSTSIVHMIILTSGTGTAYPSGAPEYCLFFFDIWILITRLVSSNSSYVLSSSLWPNVWKTTLSSS
jgi:hypothetical protein